MSKAKFTMNALLVVVIVFSAIGLFFTVGLYDMGEKAFLVVDRQPIKGTDLYIKYSTHEPGGIYRGPEYDDELLVEGNFGFDKGTIFDKGRLYLNEYRFTNTGLVLCDAVCIDTDSFEKNVIMENAILCGRCASGELVCLGDCLLSSNDPDTNSLCRLYSMTSSKIDPSSQSATVLFIDTASGETVYSMRDEDAWQEDPEERWLSRTLEEVRK